jgi:hypothetical protein
MNNVPVNIFRSLILMTFLLLCNLANAEHFSVGKTGNKHYKNLINRTDSIKVFYTMNNKDFSCKVEVVLNNMKWVSTERKISEELLFNDPLANCLSRDKAKQILVRTFLEFGQGL